MQEEDPGLSSVSTELDELKTEAKQYTLEDLKAGVWFPQLLRHALDTYAKTVDAQFFEAKYPDLNRDAIVDLRIQLAQRYAALAGGLSAGGYSAAVIATLGTKGGASPITLPAAVASFTADMLFLSRLQLRTAYDISVLYGHPIDLDDPEDLVALIRVAFGVKASEKLQVAATKLAPEAARQGVKHIAKGSALFWLQALPVVGKYLLQRNIIKMAIPGVAVPMSAGVNYYMTGRIARVARQTFRDKAFIQEVVPLLTAEASDESLLLLQVMSLMAGADGRTSEEEAWLISAVAQDIGEGEGGSESVASFRSMVDCDEGEILKQLAESPTDVKNQIYEAACVAAAMDHEFRRKEKKQLQRIAEASGLTYEPERVQRLMARLGV